MAKSRALSMESPVVRGAAQGLGLPLLTLVLIYFLSGSDLPILLAALAGPLAFRLTIAMYSPWQMQPRSCVSDHYRPAESHRPAESLP